MFDAKLAGRWDDHLPKMVTFWSSLVLGTKGYRGNVQQAHQPLDGIEPAHFSRWLSLFLKTVEARYAPPAAIRFMEPALRIAQSLQLSRFGWDYRFRPSSRRCSTRSRRAVAMQATIRTRCRRVPAVSVSDEDHRAQRRSGRVTAAVTRDAWRAA